MRYYPVFLNLEGKACLVVGAGQVGRRKVGTVLDCGVDSVTVVDTRPPDADFAPLLADPRVAYHARAFEEADLDGKFLVIASTSHEETNWRISRLCAARGLLCNIVDQPEKCSFIVPAMYTQGDLTLAISTGGTSPALAKKMRREMVEHFGAEYGAFLLLMSRLRPLVLELDKPTDENSDLFRSIVDSALLDALRDKDRARAESLLSGLLPAALLPKIPELMHGLL